jgi:nucleotide-binding universal stress UspA family protein
MRILCATDLLPKTGSALERAGMLAAQLDAELTVLHVVAATESERMLEEDMQRAREQLESLTKAPLRHQGRAPELRVQAGNVAQVLIDTVMDVDASLVVLGRHRKRPARDALVGTLAERLLSAAVCPVLIVQRMPWYAYRKVLLALDSSEASATAVRAAEELVLDAAARAGVVHAYLPRYEAMMTSAGIAASVIDAYSDACERDARAGLQNLLRTVSKNSARYELILENATTIAAVQGVLRRMNPDLLVVGTRRRGRFRRALLGSVANHLLSGARSDVLAVPARDVVAPWRRARAERLALDVIPGV